MRRFLAWLVSLVTIAAPPRRSSGEVHWQAPTAAGRHAQGYPLLTLAPDYRRSLTTPVTLTRDDWRDIAAEINWMRAPTPQMRRLREAVNRDLGLMLGSERATATERGERDYEHWIHTA